MTTRRILSHLARAYLGLVEASRLSAGERPINAPLAVAEAKQAIAHLVEAATLISPSAGVRVAEAARRAFDDAHRRAVEGDLDAHGLDEGGAAACAAEGTGGHVVDVVAGGADEEGLHGGEHGTRWPVTEEEWAELDRAVRKLGDEGWRFNLREERRQAYPMSAGPECAWCLLVRGTSYVMVDGVARCTECGRPVNGMVQ